MSFEVRTITVAGASAAIGSAGPFTLVVDRPAAAGGDGIAEIPNPLREGIAVRLGRVTVAER